MQENAILLVNKERGISSNKVVNKVKFLLNASKTGHLGTLDVLGEGVLPVTINKATKLFDYFLEKDKEYITVFKFGQTSPTLDLEGELTKEDEFLNLQEKDVKKVLSKFIGKQNQMPPQFSAKKINGKKAYQLAREGKEANLLAKEISIYNLELLEKTDKNTFKFKVLCSSGTYIRSLCRDIATELSTCGVMQSIIRTKCGKFQLKNSYSLKEIEKGNFQLIRLENLFDYENMEVNKEEFSILSNGALIDCKKEGTFKVYFDKQFLGLGQSVNGKLKIKLRLF